MKRLALTLAVTTFTLAAMAPAYALGTPKPEEFVQKASQANLFEIETSKIALARSQNDEVRMFAQKMVSDHTGAGEGLKAAAAASGFSASVASSLDEKHAKKLETLRLEDAEDFDDTYVDLQEKAHKKAVSLFKDYSEDGENAALKEFASKTLPTLENHKSEVNTLEDKVDDANIAAKPTVAE